MSWFLKSWVDGQAFGLLRHLHAMDARNGGCLYQLFSVAVLLERRILVLLLMSLLRCSAVAAWPLAT